MQLTSSIVVLAIAVFSWLALAAALSGGSRGRVAVSNGIALSTILLPMLGPRSPSWIAAALALTSAWGAAVVVDLNRDPAGLSAFGRVLHVFAGYDTRRDVTIQPYFDASRLAWVVVSLAVMVGSLVAALAAENLVLRWLLGAVFGYSAWSAFSGAILFVAHARGLEPAPFHDAPIRSKTIAEFWNRRWNRVVGAWLQRTFYRPLARRRRPRLGVAMTFIASAVLHAYFIWIPLGPKWALVMASFFLVQIVYVFAERALRVTRWPVPLRRVWTVVLLVAASPLHMEPCLQLAERALATSAW